jgi:hypothetical protein
LKLLPFQLWCCIKTGCHANIPGGEFTLEGCKKKDATRMRHSVKKAKLNEKEIRRKIREAN